MFTMRCFGGCGRVRDSPEGVIRQKLAMLAILIWLEHCSVEALFSVGWDKALSGPTSACNRMVGLRRFVPPYGRRAVRMDSTERLNVLHHPVVGRLLHAKEERRVHRLEPQRLELLHAARQV